MRATDVLVIGGGPAGAAAAARLAAGRLRVVLCERRADQRPQVCGEFVSTTAAAELEDLGVAPAQFDPRQIAQTRIFAGGASVAARLPFTGYGISRARLDPRLLEVARGQGVDVRLGVAVRRLERTGGVWSATLSGGGRIESGAVILASGKHDLRGHGRTGSGAPPVVGFKMHFRLRPEQAAALGDAVELFLYDGGYAGLQLIETGGANLCLVMSPASVGGGPEAWSGVLARLGEVAPTLDRRLRGARPLWDRPATVARVPYGYICAAEASPGTLYRVGDQAAVIPSLAGEGIAIALRSARLAAAAVLAGHGPDRYVATLRSEVLGPLFWAGMIERIMRRRPLRRLGLGVAAMPGVLPLGAALTRLARPPGGATLT